MPEHTYTLTRFCLRSGQLTLPQGMLEFFPSEGDVDVSDTLQNEKLILTMLSPRTVSGLRDFFVQHNLTVNDKLLFGRDEEGRYTLTPQPYTKGPKVQTLDEVLEALHEQGTPLSEEEIRTLYGLSAERDLVSRLSGDARFTFQEGRWQPSDTEAAPTQPEVRVAPAPDAAPPPQVTRPSQEPRPKVRRASVTPYPRGVIFPGDAALNSAQEEGDVTQQQRVKQLLTRLGYRVEGLAHAQLIAHADLGRRRYSALVHLVPEHDKLDWAALLARRRDLGTDYAAVFGHKLDLTPFAAPADLAKASLWSWRALQRLEEVLELVPISPIDLESHFERDGLLDKGLERFERGVAERVAERGTFSAVLTRLAAMKAPSIFMLDDVTDAQLSREQILGILDSLARAPFHLISKVDSGEFCLRYKVAESLVRLSQYALSLHDRLPARRTERLQAAEDAPYFAQMAAGGDDALLERE